MATTISSLTSAPSQDPTLGRLYIQNCTRIVVPGYAANRTITMASILSDSNDFEFHFNPVLDLSCRMNAFLFMLGILVDVENRAGLEIAYRMATLAFDEVSSRGWASGLSVWVTLGTNLYVLGEQRSEEAIADDDFLNDISGMSEREISMLKTEQLSGYEEGECCICLEGFLEGAVVTPLSPCSHRFHHGCIVQWLGNNRTCPICGKRFTVS